MGRFLFAHPVVSLPRTTWVGVSGNESRWGARPPCANSNLKSGAASDFSGTVFHNGMGAIALDGKRAIASL
ncbi:MAG: hypothetical protein EBE86_021350 [Hormoscilla sp. GUM202]|nr:hypothetical protein [Hormoscilla sp. GUM202]